MPILRSACLAVALLLFSLPARAGGFSYSRYCSELLDPRIEEVDRELRRLEDAGSTPVAPGRGQRLEEQLRRLRGQKRVHALLDDHRGFKTDRGLLSTETSEGYDYTLGQLFVDRLRALQPGQRWLDIGPGEMNAQRDYIAERGSLAARMAAFVLHPPKGQESRAPAAPGIDGAGVELIISEVPFEDAEVDGHGRFDLVSASYSSMAYGLYPERSIEKAGRLLKVGGTLHFNLDFIEIRAPWMTEEELWPELRWLGSIRGMRLRYQWVNWAGVDPISHPRQLAVELEKLSDDIHAPPLSLTEMDYQVQPFKRWFEWLQSP